MKGYRGYVLWGLLFVIVILILFVTRPDTDWQVQRINALQSQLSQLDKRYNGLQNKVTEEIPQAVAKAADQAANKAATQAAEQAANNTQTGLSEKAQNDLTQTITQTIQDDVTQSLTQRVDPLEQSLNTLEQETSSQLKSLQQKVQTLAETTLQSNSAVLTEQDLEPLKSSVQTLQTQVESLLNFKESQQAKAESASQSTTGMPLSSLQIQQWIIEINTQWLVETRPEQTQQQLYALEQAVSVSDFGHTSELARLIGQDLNYLQSQPVQLAQSPSQAGQGMPSSKRLRQLVKQLPTSEQSKVAPKVAPDNPDASQLEQLLSRFNAMIRVDKRGAEELKSVNELLADDVLQQRLQLLVDRLDWAVQTQSKGQLDKAIAAIENVVKNYYASEQQSFQEALQVFKETKFAQPQALAIMRLGDQ